jgi:hypothetical protein
MEKKSAFVIVGLLGGLLVYGVARHLDGSAVDAPAVSGGPEAAELRRLREQVRELEVSAARSERLAREAQVTARAAQAVVAPRVEALPALEPASGDARPPGEEGQRPAPEEPTPDEVVARLDARFFGEGVDPAWSRDATPRAERLGGLLPRGARVVSLECRSSMCRLEMSHPDLESFQGFLRDGLLGEANTWDGAFMATLKSAPGRPGGVEAVAYLARSGVSLTPDALEGP